ncbi:hypothetical protein HHI36_002626, partial [Cryptolaemus montrouzieri]
IVKSSILMDLEEATMQVLGYKDVGEVRERLSSWTATIQWKKVIVIMIDVEFVKSRTGESLRAHGLELLNL